jgi:hypothetical protein
MRKLLLAAMAGGALIGGVAMAQTAGAQAYVVYPPAAAFAEPGYHYDAYGRPYFDDGYRHPDVYAGAAGSTLGPALADAYGRVPYDRYGADPNGMLAADGHRIKCKLTDNYDDYDGRYHTRRICD